MSEHGYAFPASNKERANITIVFLYLTIPLHILNLISQSGLFLNRFISPVLKRSLDSFIFPLATLQFIIFILTIVYFIMWFRRAYNNLHIIGSKNLSWSEGWAAGSWFVPFLNFVVPYKIMREIWVETQSMCRAQGEQFEYKGAAILGWWWGIWLTENILSSISRSLMIKLRMISYETILLEGLFRNVFDITTALLLISIIKKISVWEQEMVNRFQNQKVI